CTFFPLIRSNLERSLSGGIASNFLFRDNFHPCCWWDSITHCRGCLRKGINGDMVITHHVNWRISIYVPCLPRPSENEGNGGLKAGVNRRSWTSRNDACERH